MAADGGVATQRTSAADRVLILFARFVGVGYLGYCVMLIPSIRDAWVRFDHGWVIAAVVASMVTGVLVGVAALGRTPNIAVIKRAAAVAAIGYLAALYTAPLAWEGPRFGPGTSLWLAAFGGIATFSVAFVWRPIPTLLFLVVATGGAPLIQAPFREPGTYPTLYTEVIASFVFSLAFVSAAIAALRTGEVIDEVTAASHHAAATTAAVAARDLERGRFGALIHDGVMSTLLAASRLGAVKAVGVQAVSTLDQLNELGTGVTEPSDYAIDVAIAVIRNAASAVDQRLGVAATAATGCTLPGDVVRAMAAATAEAVRNACRHAGPGARRSLDITADSGDLRVVITDDGRGFDPAVVPPHRLGLAVSVRGRMRQVVGASADVASSPGAGTTITLRWVAT